jgi:CTP:molybdopterin cytidylyltransferase MocA
MGFDKVTAPLGAVSPLEFVVRALGNRSFVIVVPSRLRKDAQRIAPAATVVINDEFERGMTHSLRIALTRIDPSSPFGVLLGDMPAITPQTLERTERVFVDGVDVAHPVNASGTPGHPVLFAANVRPIIEALPDGDTLAQARRHPSLTRAVWTCEDASAFLDLDDPQAWQAFESGGMPK